MSKGLRYFLAVRSNKTKFVKYINFSEYILLRANLNMKEGKKPLAHNISCKLDSCILIWGSPNVWLFILRLKYFYAYLSCFDWIE